MNRFSDDNINYLFKLLFASAWLRSIIPEAALRVEEEAWNAYPYTKTRYKVPFMEKFSLEIETMYLDDAGDSENVFDMSPTDLSNRIVGRWIPSMDLGKYLLLIALHFESGNSIFSWTKSMYVKVVCTKTIFVFVFEMKVNHVI